MELTTFGSVSLMAFLLTEGPTYAGTVHEKLGLPRATVSVTVARMMQRGWVESWHEDAPWRGSARRMFRLTPKGDAVARARLAELVPLIGVMQAALRGIEEDDAKVDEH